MPMYQSREGCFSTKTLANQHSAAGEVGSIVQIGTAQYVVDVGAITDTSITYFFRHTQNSNVITSTRVVNPPECVIYTYEDALSIGWPIAAAWLSVYAITYLARYLSRETNESSNYGNT